MPAKSKVKAKKPTEANSQAASALLSTSSSLSDTALSPTPSSATAPPSESIDDLKKRGNDAFSSGIYKRALELYTLAIDQCIITQPQSNGAGPASPTQQSPLPPLVPLYSNRSATCLALKNYTAALADADAAIALSPHWPKGYLRRGQALEQLLQYHEALNAYQTGLKFDPTDSMLTKSIDELSILLQELKISQDELAQQSMNPDSDRFNRMVQWLRNGGAQFPKLYLQYYSEDYRGVHCLTKIPVDDIILYVPFHSIMTSQVAMESEIGRAIQSSGVDLRSKHSYLACYLLQEKDKGEKSFWFPYMQCLPMHYHNMPIFFDNALKALLKGSFTLSKIQDRIDSLRAEYDQLKACVSLVGLYTYEQFVWARLVVITRIFGLVIHGTKTDGLVPFADMLNHKKPRDSSDTDTKWTFDDNLNGFTITSLRSINRGEQVYDSYGRKCNSRFFVNYGFSLESNEDDNEAVLTYQPIKQSDAILALKRRLLPPNTNSSNIFNVREFQVPATYKETSEREKKSKEMFSFLRFLCAVDSELLLLTTNTNNRSGYIKIEEIDPISVRNESQVLLTIQSATQHALSLFETTLEQDEKLLEDTATFPMFSNERNCLLQRRGEKQVLRWYSQLCELGLELLSLQWKDVKKRTAKCFQSHSPLDYYLTTVIVALKKKS